MNNSHPHSRYNKRVYKNNNKLEENILIHDFENKSSQNAHQSPNYSQIQKNSKENSPLNLNQGEESEQINEYYTTYEGHPEYITPLKSPELKQHKNDEYPKNLNLNLQKVSEFDPKPRRKIDLALKSSRGRSKERVINQPHSFFSGKKENENNHNWSHQHRSVNNNELSSFDYTDRHLQSMRSTFRGSKMGDDKLRYSTVDISMVKSDEQEQMGSFKNLQGYKKEKRNDPLTNCTLI